MDDFDLLLAPEHGKWEEAIDLVEVPRWTNRASALLRAQDPYQIDARLLPWLADQVGLTLWFDDWPEDKKRRAIANYPRLAKLVGTVEGIRGFLELVDVPLVGVTRPPQGAYAEAPLTPEQRELWLCQMPQLRVYPFRQIEETLEGEGYADDNALSDDEVDSTFLAVDTAQLFSGERAFFYKAGVETPLLVASIAGTNYQVAVPGTRSDAAVADDDSMSYILPPGEAYNDMLNISLDPANSYRAGGLDVTPIRSTLTPVDTRFEWVNEPYEPRPFDTFLDIDAVCDETAMAGEDDAYLHIYRRIYLLDPSVPVPFYDDENSPLDEMIIGMPPYTAIVHIDVREKAEIDAAVLDLDDGYLASTENRLLDRAMDAIRCAQGETDVLIVDTVTFTAITFGDAVPMDGSFTFGQLISRI